MSMNLGVSVGKFMAKRNGAKITFVSPPPPPGAHVDYQNPIIGLATMAAVLEKNGYKVGVVDCPCLHMTHDDLKREIARLEPDIVGITSVTATFSSALQAARGIKESYPSALIALGGPHATFMDRRILSEEPEVDIVVRGEGEQTILEIASHVADSCFKGLHEVAGITFRENGQIVQTPNRPFIHNLDQLPFPAYKYFPLRKYRLFGKLGLPIITSRGCPFQCAFCLVPRMAGKVFRARSPGNVVEELEWLRDVHGAGAFSFYDEMFTYDKKRAFEICEEIKKRNIGVPWDCQTRVDQISKELLAEMRDANCQLVSFGVESGNQKMLDTMKKGTTVEQNERAIRWAKEAGLSVAISVVIGYPGETMDTLEQTLDFIRRTEPDDAYLSLATPYPGTELYDLVKDLGWKMSDEWTHYETRTPVFETPSLPSEKIKKTRETFYNHFYSWPYILRQSLKGFNGQVRARTAMHHLFWQTKIPSWISDNLKKLTRL
jgi:anaerobic magnesium-protoporphyrin IX monomethyl ester cyclase